MFQRIIAVSCWFFYCFAASGQMAENPPVDPVDLSKNSLNNAFLALQEATEPLVSPEGGAAAKGVKIHSKQQVVPTLPHVQEEAIHLKGHDRKQTAPQSEPFSFAQIDEIIDEGSLALTDKTAALNRVDKSLNSRAAANQIDLLKSQVDQQKVHFDQQTSEIDWLKFQVNFLMDELHTQRILQARNATAMDSSAGALQEVANKSGSQRDLLTNRMKMESSAQDVQQTPIDFNARPTFLQESTGDDKQFFTVFSNKDKYIEPAEWAEEFGDADADDSGQVDWNEFMQWLNKDGGDDDGFTGTGAYGGMTDANAKNLFQAWANEGEDWAETSVAKGTITLAEWLEEFGDADCVGDTLDVGDGFVDEQEFCAWLTKTTKGGLGADADSTCAGEGIDTAKYGSCTADMYTT